MGQSHKTSQGERMVGLILLLTWVVITSGQRNERPTFVDPVLYTKTIYASLSAKCPAGIIKCECLNAVGTFTEGPFDPDEDPLQALITYVGCARITHKRRSICDLNFPPQYWTFVRGMS